MKITDTLEQIIEKVEPYMDKTLSEGCLIKFSLQQILGDYVEIIVPLIEILPKDNNWEYK